MSWLHIVILAIIQGLTEFLPVSSSAHLILPAQIFGWEDQGPMIDVMAHFGSLFAVMLYFRRDIARTFRGFFDLVRRRLNTDSCLALNLVLTTPPALLFGAFLSYGGYDTAIRLPVIFALTSIIFGILLWWADVTFARHKTTDDLTWRGAVLLGLSQAVALIPGTSRSGITMMTARMMSMGRAEAARFSMLMSLPVIGAGGIFALYRLSQAGPGVTGSPGIGLTVAVLSFVAAYVSISLFMTWVSRIGMFPFMVYRIAFGIGLLLWIGL